jgi:predicted membrane protein
MSKTTANEKHKMSLFIKTNVGFLPQKKHLTTYIKWDDIQIQQAVGDVELDFIFSCQFYPKNNVNSFVRQTYR